YGKTKLAGEHAVAAACRRHVILRTSWLYSHVASNFLKTMLRLAEDKRPLRVVNDQFGSPTFAWDLGSATVAVVNAIESGREDIYGLYHAANTGMTSWYGFAERIFRIHGDIVDLSGIPTSEYPTPAPRPAYSVLSCDRLREVLDFSMPNWEDALSRCLARL
ncbi:MAG: sugar nucleotide-binding protein, partial [Proteobacteria bacterium]|nr:sugar nucleotide-binding protein [Pseudomonadota bacterium]